MVYWWTSGADDDPRLNQHWFNALCFLWSLSCKQSLQKTQQARQYVEPQYSFSVVHGTCSFTCRWPEQAYRRGRFCSGREKLWNSANFQIKSKATLISDIDTNDKNIRSISGKELRVLNPPPPRPIFGNYYSHLVTLSRAFKIFKIVCLTRTSSVLIMQINNFETQFSLQTLLLCWRWNTVHMAKLKIYRGLRIGRDCYLDYSEAYVLYRNLYSFPPKQIKLY